MSSIKCIRFFSPKPNLVTSIFSSPLCPRIRTCGRYQIEQPFHVYRGTLGYGSEVQALSHHESSELLMLMTQYCFLKSKR
ncbi:hypothetical protein TMatcc_009417 [Talaromyces marneffei ATCC 18224]